MMWSPPILLQVSLEWLMSPQYITIVVLDIQVWQLSDTAPTPTPSVQKHWTELESNSLWIMYKVRCSKFFSSLCQWLRIKDNWIIPFRFFFFFGGGISREENIYQVTFVRLFQRSVCLPHGIKIWCSCFFFPNFHIILCPQWDTIEFLRFHDEKWEVENLWVTFCMMKFKSCSKIWCWRARVNKETTIHEHKILSMSSHNQN